MPLYLNELSANWVDAWASVATAAFTLTLAIIVRRQIGLLATQHRQSATLEACNRYDTEDALRAHREAIERFMENPIKDPLDHIAVDMAWTAIFNYFDAVAIGLHQKLYDGDIAHDLMADILRDWIDDLGAARDATSVEFRVNFKNNFRRTLELCASWEIPTDSLK